jgi:dihydrodipicolinate synthase/N-acetylneuraminate lyase
MENEKLTGTIVPLVTPLAADESFDEGAMGRGIEVGTPRRPGSAVDQADQAHLKQLMAGIAQAEAAVTAALATQD